MVLIFKYWNNALTLLNSYSLELYIAFLRCQWENS